MAKKIVCNFIATCFLFIAYCFFPTIAYSTDSIEIKDIKYLSTPEYTRISVELSKNAEYTKGRLPDPERIYLDIKDARLSKGIKRHQPVTDKFLKAIRIGTNSNIVRIVLDLNVTAYIYKTTLLNKPDRIIIDILPQKAEENKVEIRIDEGLFKRRLVIDAGHGGHDPGAIGPNGLYEKDVVLDIALKVRDIINREYPQYEVILTRDRDIFIPLDERTNIANKNNADLFISIHANASPNKYAKGIETYILNWTDDEEAMKVAARENAISLKRMREVQNEIGIILASLERESKRDESVKLAGYIQKSLISRIQSKYTSVHNLGVKQALFYVLVGAKMPSALVEVSFISNSEEERLLADESYREILAYSIVNGIDSYFSSVPSQKMAVDSGFKPISAKYADKLFNPNNIIKTGR